MKLKQLKLQLLELLEWLSYPARFLDLVSQRKLHGPCQSCCYRLSVTLLYFKQAVLFHFQVQRVDLWATSDSSGVYLPRISTRATLGLPVKTWKRTGFAYVHRSVSSYSPKKSRNAIRKGLRRARLLWSCPSRTGNGSCKRARGREIIRPDNMSLQMAL